MGIELDWLNKHYYARGIGNTGGNNGVLFKRRGCTDSHVQSVIPPEWTNAWISNTVTRETETFGIALSLDAAGRRLCVSLRTRVHEWMLGIEE